MAVRADEQSMSRKFIGSVARIMDSSMFHFVSASNAYLALCVLLSSLC